MGSKKDNLEILREKILKGRSHGVFIAPKLSEKERENLKKGFDRPFIFVEIPICHPRVERIVEFRDMYWLDGFWVPALKEKTDFRIYKEYTTISLKHFTKYVIGTFGSYGIIIVMRHSPMGFNNIQRRESIDGLERDSEKLTKDVSSEIEALELLWKMKPSNTHIVSKEANPEIIIKDTGLTYNDDGICIIEEKGRKTLFKARTAKYVVFRVLLERYNSNFGPITREELAQLLSNDDHKYNVNTIKTLISKIRDVIRNIGDIGCKKDTGKYEKPGYYFIPKSTNRTT